MHKGDVLVVWRLDRLARSVRQLVDTAADLHARGIELRSLHDAIDTSTATGRLTFHLFAALTDFERDVIREINRCSGAGGCLCWAPLRQGGASARSRTFPGAAPTARR